MEVPARGAVKLALAPAPIIPAMVTFLALAIIVMLALPRLAAIVDFERGVVVDVSARFHRAPVATAAAAAAATTCE